MSLAAGALFAEVGIELPPDEPEATLRNAGWVRVAGSPAVGFAAMGELDGAAHVEELAVRPDAGRRGVGSALLAAVCSEAAQRGYARVTLTTFRDVPWNAPFYARRGFTELPRDEWGEQLVAQWRAEEAAGILVAPRVAMSRSLWPAERA